MIKVIFNDEWVEGTKVHLEIDDRAHEECNTDQIDNKVKMPLREFLLNYEIVEDDLCLRCFPEEPK